MGHLTQSPVLLSKKTQVTISDSAFGVSCCSYLTNTATRDKSSVKRHGQEGISSPVGPAGRVVGRLLEIMAAKHTLQLLTQSVHLISPTAVMFIHSTSQDCSMNYAEYAAERNVQIS